jgi:sugar phosphate permease
MMIACCVIMMSLALQTTCLSLFTKPVSDALGFSRSAFTAYISISGIMLALSMPLWGKLLPRIGIRAMICICGIVTGLCFVLAGRSDSLWQFYAIGVAYGFVSPGITVFPTAVVINNWFREKRGLAMGIALAFSGVGAAVFSPWLTWIIDAHSWQYGYMTIGIVSLALTLPVGLFVLRASPEETGLTPYGAEYPKDENARKTVDQTGVPMRAALRSFPFYGVILSVFLAALAVVSVSQHIPAFLISRGVPELQTGAAMSILSIAFMLAKVGFGWLNDRIGALKGILICYAFGFAGLFLLKAFTGVTIPVFPLIIAACGIPVTTVWPPLLTARMFGQRDYSGIFAFVQGAAVLGYGLGTPLYGLSYDKTGSYDTMIVIGLVMMPVAAILMVLSFKGRDKLPIETEAK